MSWMHERPAKDTVVSYGVWLLLAWWVMQGAVCQVCPQSVADSVMPAAEQKVKQAVEQMFQKCRSSPASCSGVSQEAAQVNDMCACLSQSSDLLG
jgi:hypothetical protein